MLLSFCHSDNLSIEIRENRLYRSDTGERNKKRFSRGLEFSVCRNFFGIDSRKKDVFEKHREQLGVGVTGKSPVVDF